ncbi:TetR/AcrR family transcriptional regulator C-terminal domain-containing protein, partial [Mycobacterium tuberculosis]|nr:TetR/AcrR family transcriptional regulator C-terminal domain-containing protein [Mycobacterium tuberculosis]
LMLDRVQYPDEEVGADADWRETLRFYAHQTLELYRRHPWLLQVNQTRPVLGPGALANMELLMGRIMPMKLSDPELVS